MRVEFGGSVVPLSDRPKHEFTKIDEIPGKLTCLPA